MITHADFGGQNVCLVLTGPLGQRALPFVTLVLFCMLGMFLLEPSLNAQESTNAVVSKATQAAETLENKEAKAKQQEVRLKARVLIAFARVDLENGRFEEAEKKLRGALGIDPTQRAASYYLTLIKERRASRQNASVEPIYPVIRKYDGTLQYGIPAHKRLMREVADDLKGK